MTQFEASNDNRSPGGERRAVPRRRVLLDGKIVSPHDKLSADCTVRDLSPRGARITAALPNGAGAGAALILVRQGLLHPYRLAWLSNTEAGLRFVSAVDLRRPDALPANFAPARRLWLDLAPR